ncbi:hypothetical protein FB550_1182 [Neobacillus bataviensis]|uniref:Parallel beta helix pectate lyase-like protein n=1 Tax=Neobacillus bataviensis TaxID=220685 RepID=A0A561CN25_9BACI|nr:hypothetical protein [Neobacillus bataviensis]TWD92372.1 hypothetical protein FB550_1182 [Neobacillus bataviensis]
MKNWLLGIFTSLLLLFVVGYYGYNYILDLAYDIVSKKINVNNIQVSKESFSSFKDVIGDGKKHRLYASFKTKSEAINNYPFLHWYLKENPEVNWKELEMDWVVIQNAIEESGLNSKVTIPKAFIGYRINRPIIIKQGQTIVFSPNTKIFDHTSDYAIKIVGGTKFPDDSITNVNLGNLDIIGSNDSKGAIKLQNAYLINFDNIKISNYGHPEAKGIFLQDVFQINLNTIQINNLKNGTGIYVDSIEGNSGQLNFINTIVQRSKIGIHVIGRKNLIDGINFYGGAIGNNYSKGVLVGKNVYNLNFTGSHFENHDGKNQRGTTAVNMELPNGYSAESINFIGCTFINNKYSIKSNNTKRVNISGNQFDGRNIQGSIAIKQGNGDAAWLINPNYFINNDQTVIDAGKDHVYLSSISINSKGVLFPQKTKAGIYSGAKDPEGNVEAKTGSIYLRTDSTSHFHVYVKQSNQGKKGWKPLK